MEKNLKPVIGDQPDISIRSIHSCPGFIRMEQFFRTCIRKDSREKIFRLSGRMMRHMKKSSAVQTDPSDELPDRRIVIITFRQKMSDGMVVIQRILPTVRIPASNHSSALQTPPQCVFHHHFFQFHWTERIGKTLGSPHSFPFRFFHAITSERFFLIQLCPDRFFLLKNPAPMSFMSGPSAPLFGLIFLCGILFEHFFRTWGAPSKYFFIPATKIQFLFQFLVSFLNLDKRCFQFFFPFQFLVQFLVAYFCQPQLRRKQ